MRTIGTCSNCSGPVQLPDRDCWTRDDRPECGHCGAKALEPYGRTIPMRPPADSNEAARRRLRSILADYHRRHVQHKG